MATFPADPGAYIPPLSLWQLVEQHVSPNEQQEIKNMLGDSLVDQTLELRDEINLLLEIWQDYREETDSKTQDTPRLAEPPHVRERLIQEICFLAESVKEKALMKGMDLPAVLSRHNSEVLEYAQETQRSGSSLGSARPLTARSSDGRQTPLSPKSEANSRQSLSTTISGDVSSANDKLNFLEFNDVCKRLRSTLEKEMEQLERDITFLHGCLDDEASVRSCGGTPALSREPTITDLREERSLLEKELLSTQTVPSTPPVHKPHFVPSVAAGGIKMQNLGPAVAKRRPVQTTPPGSAKMAPLKASHHIALVSASPESLAISSEFSSVSSSDAGSGTANTERLDKFEAEFSRSHPGTKAQGRVRADSDRAAAHCPSSPSQPADVSSSSSTTSASSERSPGSSTPSPGSHYQSSSEGEEGIHRKSGTGARRRTVSPGRVKVVPVGSIIDPRIGAGDGGHFIPTPPPSDKPQLPRPSSAERFRKFVLQCRDGT